MDFIERIFHISPDGGSGAFEILALVVVAALILAYRSRHRIASVFRRRSDDEERPQP